MRLIRTAPPSTREWDLLFAALEPGSRKSAFERNFRKLRSECGCRVAGASCVVATLVFLAAIAFGVMPLDSALQIAGALAVTPAVALAAAAGGKLLGIALARYRLYRLRRELAAYVRSA